MKLESDEATREWLMNFIPILENFDWDEGNVDKNLIKHNVSREKIESIFQNPIVFAGKIIEPRHFEWRGLILGLSVNQRHLSLIFTQREDRLRPISCRPMRKEEEKIYHAKTKN